MDKLCISYRNSFPSWSEYGNYFRNSWLDGYSIWVFLPILDKWNGPIWWSALSRISSKIRRWELSLCTGHVSLINNFIDPVQRALIYCALEFSLRQRFILCWPLDWKNWLLKMKVFGNYFENVKSEATLGNGMLRSKMKLKILKSGHQR